MLIIVFPDPSIPKQKYRLRPRQALRKIFDRVCASADAQALAERLGRPLVFKFDGDVLDWSQTVAGADLEDGFQIEAS